MQSQIWHVTRFFSVKEDLVQLGAIGYNEVQLGAIVTLSNRQTL